MPDPPHVTVRQSRFWATNTTIITTSAGCLLVDPGVYPDELRATAASLAGPVLAAVHTHAHWDHVLWTAELEQLAAVEGPGREAPGREAPRREAPRREAPRREARRREAARREARGREAAGLGRPAGVPRFVTDATWSLLEASRALLLDQLMDVMAGREPGSEAGEPWDLDVVGRGTPLPDGAPVPWHGPTALLLQTGGHLRGHGSLHLPDLGVLVAGDLVSDVDVPFPHWSDPPAGEGNGDGDDAAVAEGLTPYRLALERLAGLPRVTTVIPGHGTPIGRSGYLQRIDDDRRYLDDLQEAVDASDSAAEALARASHIPDERLADPDVRAAHDTSVRLLFLSRRPA